MSVTEAQHPVQTTAKPLAEIRRFQIPDLDRHGKWILERLLVAYPHLDQRTAIGWLRGLIYDNDCLFLYQEHSVALAQVERIHTLSPRPRIRERFVLCQPGFEDEAAEFYTRIAQWAKHQSCSIIIVLELSDVPEPKVRAKLGRIFEKPQKFAKVE